MTDCEKLSALYNAYVDGYRGPDGALPEMMELKLRHTERVVANANAIAAAEKFSPLEKTAAESAALLHDTGRYEQLRLYGTFRDSESIDHAEFSYETVVEKGWLGGWDEKLRDTVLAAVRYHNKRDLPPGLDPFTEKISHVVRDADKLDIFNVLEERVNSCGGNLESSAFWGLRPAERPSAEVVEAILAGRPVDYNLIRSLADFTLVQVGWMVSGLHFAESRRLCAARGHLDFREKFLLGITGPSGRDDIAATCSAARSALAAAVSGNQGK